MATDLLAQLNPQQREAVLHDASPLLIVAGAGSGKTRVITHKIAHLVQDRGLAPAHILGLTFTNKAAEEMKTRIEALTGIAARLFSISTFHSLGLRLLRESGRALGFSARWRVIDETDQRKLMDKLAADGFAHWTNDMREAALRKINLAKMNLCYPNHAEVLRQRGFDDEEIALFGRYFAHQQENQIWDFEDLISLAVTLLQNVEKLREKYEDKFRYVLVDEFQDTNPNQYELIRLIAGRHHRITAVGDDDQAIYSWRGASVRFLFDFERDFPGTRIIKLEQNYRSTRQILGFANDLISRNLQRRGKTMWSESAAGSRVYLLQTRSKEDEAEQLARFVLQLAEQKPDLLPVALLYRINSQSLPLESEFTKRGIPFQILRGLRFFERKEVKDCLALLGLVFNPDDDLAFLRLIEFLPLGIGAKTLQVLEAHAREQSLSLFRTLQQLQPDKFAGRPIFAAVAELHEQRSALPVSQQLQTLLARARYLEILQQKGEEERSLNIQELGEFIKKWEGENPGEDFSGLLDRLLLESREKTAPEKVKAFLLTMHNAKGLEFPTVLVCGLNGAYMPFFLHREREEIEEERRLFYVAATRAVSLLVLSSASDRLSPFLLDIHPDRYSRAYSLAEILEDAELAAVAAIEKPGLRFLRHPFFGRGKIIDTLSESKYLVQFSEKGTKVIDTSVVPVEFL